MISNLLDKVLRVLDQSIIRSNHRFNSLTNKSKKTIILLFGLLVSGISLILIIQALHSQENKVEFKPDRIAMPHDIFMKEESTMSEEQLVPVGKMKGEIDGEFESFYVAVDSKGLIYINREIEYTENAYDKTKGWEQISKEKLSKYEQDLHFIPSRAKGLRR